MKKKIHPQYVEAEVICACGSVFKVMSTKPQFKTVVCSNCHPFYTGKEKLIDTTGRVEQFKKKFQSPSK